MYSKSMRVPLMVAVGLLVGLGLGEIVVRAAGRSPYTDAREFLERPFIAMREPDPQLGWRNRSGEYGDVDGSGPRVRILPDGSRITSEDPPDAGKRVVLVGGSFVFGQALGDEDTLAWVLQEGDRRRRYSNFGVAGFGTCQALLLLERLFEGDDPPAYVIYGLIEHHKIRNVGKRSWLKNLVRTASSANVTLPSCDVDDSGALVRYLPARYREWPLQRVLAVMNLTQDAVMAAADRPRMNRRQEITEAVLREMDHLCRERGAEFLTLLLEPEQARSGPDVAFLQRSGIPFLDLRFPLTAELVVPGDGHPNGLVTRRWAKVIAARISEDTPAAILAIR